MRLNVQQIGHPLNARHGGQGDGSLVHPWLLRFFSRKLWCLPTQESLLKSRSTCAAGVQRSRGLPPPPVLLFQASRLAWHPGRKRDNVHGFWLKMGFLWPRSHCERQRSAEKVEEMKEMWGRLSLQGLGKSVSGFISVYIAWLRGARRCERQVGDRVYRKTPTWFRLPKSQRPLAFWSLTGTGPTFKTYKKNIKKNIKFNICGAHISHLLPSALFYQWSLFQSCSPLHDSLCCKQDTQYILFLFENHVLWHQT